MSGPLRYKYHQSKSSLGGFTIVELLIVVVVIAILAAITIVAYNGIQQRAQTSALQSAISQASRKLEVQKVSSGTNAYPSDLNAAGITVPGGYTYVYERTTNTEGYCLSAVNNTTSYKVTNSAPSPQIGGCVPTSGLVGSWTFNGNTNDSSGNGMNGVVNGATPVQGQDGQANGAYSFNGTNNYITLSNTTPLNFTNGQFTVSAWINLATMPAVSAWSDILSSTGGGDWSFGINVASNGLSYLRMTKVSQIDAPVGPGVAQNAWKFVSAVYTYGPSPSTVSYYLDGDLTSTVNWNHSGQGDFSPSTKRIGSRSTNGFFRGTIDDLRVYNRGLVSGEIRSMFAAGAQ